MISRKYYFYINKIYFEIGYLRIIGGKKNKNKTKIPFKKLTLILKLRLNKEY